MLIEIFSSPGCSKCSHARETLKALVVELGQERIEWREVNVLDELDHAVELGILSTPAIAVDGELVFTSLPNTSKLRDYLLQKVEADK